MTKASAQKRAEALALLRAHRVGGAALARRAGRPGRGHGGAARGGARAPAGQDSRPATRKVPQGRRPGHVRGGRAVRDRAGQLPGGRARGRKPALREHLTPAAEEVLFRGWLWGELQAALPSGRSVFAWNAALFALWHIGYVVPNLAAGELAAVAGKVAAGRAYGVLLAAIRRRTGNAWGAFLAHGVCTLFRI